MSGSCIILTGSYKGIFLAPRSVGDHQEKIHMLALILPYLLEPDSPNMSRVEAHVYSNPMVTSVP